MQRQNFQVGLPGCFILPCNGIGKFPALFRMPRQDAPPPVFRERGDSLRSPFSMGKVAPHEKCPKEKEESRKAAKIPARIKIAFALYSWRKKMGLMPPPFIKRYPKDFQHDPTPESFSLTDGKRSSQSRKASKGEHPDSLSHC